MFRSWSFALALAIWSISGWSTAHAASNNLKISSEVKKVIKISSFVARPRKGPAEVKKVIKISAEVKKVIMTWIRPHRTAPAVRSSRLPHLAPEVEAKEEAISLTDAAIEQLPLRDLLLREE